MSFFLKIFFLFSLLFEGQILWFPKPQVVLDLGFNLWLGRQTDLSPGQKIEPPLPGELYSDCGFFLFQFQTSYFNCGLFPFQF